MKTNCLIFLIVILGLLVVACVGPKGEDGIDGKDANVGSAIYDIEPSDWTGNIDGFLTTLTVPEINEDVFYDGAVLVFMLKNENAADRSFNPLPYTWLNNGKTEYMDFDAFIGKVNITIRWVDNGINNTEAPNSRYTFKVLIIQGMQLSVLENQVNLSNYHEVMKFLSVKGNSSAIMRL
jgi:hypothetical protein